MKKVNKQVIIVFLLHSILSIWVFNGYANWGALSISSGNPEIDRFYYDELERLEHYFEVDVDFRFEHNTSKNNAYASSESISDGTDGTVAFTMPFVEGNLDDYTIASVFAHEMAHILQFKNGWSFSDSKYDELFADMMAGVYLCTRPDLMRNLDHFRTTSQWHFDYVENIPFYDIQHAISRMEQFGDYYVNHPDHHGTNTERLHATIAGYLVAAYSFNMYRQPKYMPDAMDFYLICKNLIYSDCLDFSRIKAWFDSYERLRLSEIESLFFPETSNNMECVDAVFEQLPSIVYLKTSIVHNTYVNGVLGMKVFSNFEANNLKGDQIWIQANVMSDGACPTNWYTGECLFKRKYLKPTYQYSSFTDIEFFIPYNEIPVYSSGTHQLEIQLTSGLGDKPLAYMSRPVHFLLTK